MCKALRLSIEYSLLKLYYKDQKLILRNKRELFNIKRVKFIIFKIIIIFKSFNLIKKIKKREIKKSNQKNNYNILIKLVYYFKYKVLIGG